MLKPLSHTNYCLNSIANWNNIYNTYNENSSVTFENRSVKHRGKQVALTKGGIPHQGESDTAMAKQRRAKRNGKRKEQRTPQPKEPEPPVIGSSCTWRDTELDHFKVKVERDVDVRKMIPDRFFSFDNLENYKECILSPLDWLMVRQSGALCAV